LFENNVYRYEECIKSFLDACKDAFIKRKEEVKYEGCFGEKTLIEESCEKIDDWLVCALNDKVLS